MISGGHVKKPEVKTARPEFLTTVTGLAKAGLEGVEAGLKGEVLREVQDVFTTTSLPITPQGAAKATLNRAKGFGNVAGYLASKVGDEALRIASFLPGLSLPAQGALLAGLVKKAFVNEGGKNE